MKEHLFITLAIAGTAVLRGPAGSRLLHIPALTTRTHLPPTQFSGVRRRLSSLRARNSL